MNALIEALKNLAAKVGDQAHLGKLLTDFTPGLIVVLTLLAGIDAFTSFEVLPYLNYEQYRDRTDIARVKHQRYRQQTGELRRQIEDAERAANRADQVTPELLAYEQAAARAKTAKKPQEEAAIQQSLI